MIWVDITNYPHVLFFKDFIKRHDVFVTTRKFGQLTSLLDSQGIEYTVVGSHGGKEPYKKLEESAKRMGKLAKLVSSKDVSIAVSKQSVELPRVAFGLGIPTVQIVDNEYAEHQNRLFLPLCSRVVVPEYLDRIKLYEQGARPSQIKIFRGLCEVSQLKNFTPDESILEKYGLEDYILIRPEPHSAAYFQEDEMAQRLVTALRDAGMNPVILPRDKELKGGVNLKNVDSLSLIYFAKAVLSGGGTMNRESALLGTPTISFYPSELLGVDRFLIQNGLLYHSTDIDEILRMLQELDGRKNEYRKKAQTMLKVLQDPFEVVEEEISTLEGQPS
jgi:hypothetical protein